MPADEAAVRARRDVLERDRVHDDVPALEHSLGALVQAMEQLAGWFIAEREDQAGAI
jgi:hypothetical protein